LSLANDVYDPFMKIIIGINHVLVHVPEDGKIILWMQDNEILETLKVINEQVQARYNRGREVYDVITAVIQNK